MERAPLREDLARGPAGGAAYWIRTEDGLRLRIGHWPGNGGTGEGGTVFLLPGRTEYVEKYGLAAADLARRGFGTVTIDWRGQGLSPRLHPDPLRGHLIAFADFQKDLDSLLAAAEAMALPRPWFVLSHSMGGAIALRRLTGAHPFAAAVFSAPMWGIGLPRGLAPWAPRIARMLRRSTGLVWSSGRESYPMRTGFLGNVLTRDAAMWGYMLEQQAGEPGLRLGGPSWQWVSEGILECCALADLPSPEITCLTTLGGDERVIDPEAVRARMARWPGGRLLPLPGVRHEVMMDGAETRAMFFDAVAETFRS